LQQAQTTDRCCQQIEGRRRFVAKVAVHCSPRAGVIAAVKNNVLISRFLVWRTARRKSPRLLATPKKYVAKIYSERENSNSKVKTIPNAGCVLERENSLQPKRTPEK
jgi:hypothetical protein